MSSTHHILSYVYTVVFYFQKFFPYLNQVGYRSPIILAKFEDIEKGSTVQVGFCAGSPVTAMFSIAFWNDLSVCTVEKSHAFH